MFFFWLKSPKKGMLGWRIRGNNGGKEEWRNGCFWKWRDPHLLCIEVWRNIYETALGNIYDASISVL